MFKIAHSRLFVGLVMSTIGLIIGLIIFGAIVRVTDSGLGCGNQWPLCNGSVVPPLDNITAWIEWLHRLFAMLIGLFGLATLVVAWRSYRSENRMILNATILGAVLFFVQSMLGALVVVLDLPPTFVTMHLGTAMLLLGALLWAATGATFKSALSYQPDAVTWLVYLNTLFAFLIILIGALVRGSGATLACSSDWPLCFGTLLPAEQGQMAMVHMIHRLAVGAFGITLLLLVWMVYKARDNRLIQQLALWSFIVFLLQVAVGALFVFTAAGAEWGAAHVGFAALTWGLLVILSVLEAINTGLVGNNYQADSWKPHLEGTRSQ